MLADKYIKSTFIATFHSLYQQKINVHKILPSHYWKSMRIFLSIMYNEWKSEKDSVTLISAWLWVQFLAIGIFSDIIQYFAVILFLSHLKADREKCHTEENSCRKRVLIFEISFKLFFAIFFRQDFKIGFKCRSKFALAVIADSPCNLRNAFIGFF